VGESAGDTEEQLLSTVRAPHNSLRSDRWASSEPVRRPSSRRAKSGRRAGWSRTAQKASVPQRRSRFTGRWALVDGFGRGYNDL
jgi:hypothetical protein